METSPTPKPEPAPTAEPEVIEILIPDEPQPGKVAKVKTTWATRASKLGDEILDTNLRSLGGVLSNAFRSITTDLGIGLDIRVKGKSVSIGSKDQVQDEDQ